MEIKIISHLPTAEKDIKELEKRVAEVHAGAVIRYICRHKCPKEQKKELLNKLIHN